MFNNAVPISRDVLEGRYAFTFADDEELEVQRQGYLWNEYCGWTGWKRRMWPAKVLRSDTQAYVFNKQRRALVGLYRIVHCEVFEFTSMEQFARRVKKGCREIIAAVESPTSRRLGSDIGDPDSATVIAPPESRPASFKKWNVVEERLAGNAGMPCTGIAFCAQRVRTLDPTLTLLGKFPQIGWCDLHKPGFGLY